MVSTAQSSGRLHVERLAVESSGRGGLCQHSGSVGTARLGGCIDLIAKLNFRTATVIGQGYGTKDGVGQVRRL